MLNAAQRVRLIPNTCVVQNTQPHSPGEHWIGVGCFKDAHGKIKTMGFDTYGRNEDFEARRELSVDVWTDPDKHQTLNSEVCGAMALAWCVIFIRRGYVVAAEV